MCALLVGCAASGPEVRAWLWQEYIRKNAGLALVNPLEAAYKQVQDE